MHKLARLTPMGRLRMVRRLEAGERLGDVAAALDLSTTTVRRWWRRYQQDGVAGLADRSSRPIARRGRSLEPAAGRSRAGDSGAGVRSGLLGISGCPCPPSSMSSGGSGSRGGRALRPLRSAATSAPARASWCTWISKNWAASAAWAIGFTAIMAAAAAGVAWNSSTSPSTIGPLAYAALFPDETATSAAAFLALAHRWFAGRGVAMRALLTDNGSAYRGRRFGALCGRLGLRHHWTRPYRPQTNGKAERFIRTCLTEWAYARSYRSSVVRASALPVSCDTTTRTDSTWAFSGLTPMQRLAAHQ